MTHRGNQYISENAITSLLVESIIADIHVEQISFFSDGDETHLAKIKKLETELMLLDDCGYIEARKAA